MRILIANRGEIACRLTQACHELGHEAIAIYTKPDRTAKHVQLADQALAVRSYLDIKAVIGAAKRAKVAAMHPGYGFLSENPELPGACQQAGITFIGPPADVIRLMGDKLRAKDFAAKAGLPLVPGSDGEDPSEVGFPLLIKAAAGGGGKGMRTVADPADFAAALASAKREAQAAFGDARVFLERVVTHGRHVEVQIFGDAQGNIVHFGERDCSIQRRYQKIVEESPAPNLPAGLRSQLHAAAVALGQAAGYIGPGTVEFLVEDDAFYFLEMNTRLQVEHPVTELVSGIDLAKLQIEVAFGGVVPTPYTQHPTPSPKGHAIEARVYAEDPEHGFVPASGTIRRLELPAGPGIRNDIGIQQGDEIGIGFDPLLAKLIVWGADRAEALARLRDALCRYCVLGVTTNLNFLLTLANDPDFEAANLNTRFLDEHPGLTAPHSSLLTLHSRAAQAWTALRSSPDPFRHGWQAPTGAERMPDGGLLLDGKRWYVAEDERRIEVWRDGCRAVFAKQRPPSVDETAGASSAGAGKEAIASPLTGMVVKVLVKDGDSVEPRQTLIVLEAMKMEHAIQAPFAGTVARVHVKSGVLAEAGAPLVELTAI